MNTQAKNTHWTVEQYQASIDQIISSLVITSSVAWAAEDMCRLFTTMTIRMVSTSIKYLAAIHDVTITGQTARAKRNKAVDKDIWRRLLDNKVRYHKEQQFRQQPSFNICSTRAVDDKEASDEAQQEYLRRKGYLAADGSPIVIQVEKKWKSEYAEKLVRCLGIQSRAEARQLRAMMVTITCPCRFHFISDNYDGSSPRDANKYLMKQWQRFRAAAKKKGLALEFIRSVEPHNDGTPHWHLMLWTGNKSHTAKLLKRYFMDTDEPFEKGQLKRFCISDKANNSIYYLIKQYQIIDKLGTINPVSKLTRAWAKAWGIRTFDTSKSDITVYRQLRRRSMTVHDDANELKQACIGGDYAQFLTLNAALKVKASYTNKVNIYGEVVHQLTGLSFNHTVYRAIRVAEQHNNTSLKVTLSINDPSNTQIPAYQCLLTCWQCKSIWIPIRGHYQRCRGPPNFAP